MLMQAGAIDRGVKGLRQADIYKAYHLSTVLCRQPNPSPKKYKNPTTTVIEPVTFLGNTNLPIKFL